MSTSEDFSLGYSKTVREKCIKGEDALIHALFYIQYERSKLTPGFTEKRSQHGEPLNWFYHSGEKVYGPYPASAMFAWYKQNKLRPDLLVRKGTMGMFVMLKSLTKGLASGENPFADISKSARANVMKDAYTSLIGTVAAMRVTQ